MLTPKKVYRVTPFEADLAEYGDPQELAGKLVIFLEYCDGSTSCGYVLEKDDPYGEKLHMSTRNLKPYIEKIDNWKAVIKR